MAKLIRISLTSHCFSPISPWNTPHGLIWGLQLRSYRNNSIERGWHRISVVVFYEAWDNHRIQEFPADPALHSQSPCFAAIIQLTYKMPESRGPEAQPLYSAVCDPAPVFIRLTCSESEWKERTAPCPMLSFLLSVPGTECQPLVLREPGAPGLWACRRLMHAKQPFFGCFCHVGKLFVLTTWTVPPPCNVVIKSKRDRDNYIGFGVLFKSRCLQYVLRKR